MPFEATFVSGSPRMIDHTPSGDIAAGEVVVIDGIPYVAHRPIAANVLGSVAAEGGVYDLVKDGTSGPVFIDGEGVAWIVSTNLASDVLTGNAHFGTAVGAAATGSAVVRALHRPIMDTANETT